MVENPGVLWRDSPFLVEEFPYLGGRIPPPLHVFQRLFDTNGGRIPSFGKGIVVVHARARVRVRGLDSQPLQLRQHSHGLECCAVLAMQHRLGGQPLRQASMSCPDTRLSPTPAPHASSVFAASGVAGGLIKGCCR